MRYSNVFIDQRAEKFRNFLAEGGKMKNEEKPDATYVQKPMVMPDYSYTEPIEVNIFKELTFPAFAHPARFLVSDVVRKQLGMKGKTYTEKNLSPTQLQALDNQVRQRVKDNGITRNYFIQHPNDTVKIGLDAPTLYPKMYGRNYGVQNLGYKLITPEGQVETIIGNVGEGDIKIYRNGYEVNDVYDFNVGQGEYPESYPPFALARRFAGKYGHTDKDPDSSKNKFKIKRKVNHW